MCVCMHEYEGEWMRLIVRVRVCDFGIYLAIRLHYVYWKYMYNARCMIAIGLMFLGLVLLNVYLGSSVVLE